MNVPLADLHAQYLSIKPEIDAAIQGVIDSSQFILGKAVSDFERSFADAHRMKHCIAVGSGTDALHCALWALGIGPGDAVVTTPFTFIATVEAITLVGARPLFVDIEPDTFTLDPGKLDRLLSSRQSTGSGASNIRAVIPVHLYGQPADMAAIGEICLKYQLAIIEDACQSHLATFQGKLVGHFGSAACFSFYPGKNLGAYGEAGAVTTDDDALAEKIRRLRDHGQVEKYHHAFPGHNYRMDGIQGAVLGAKLRHLGAWTERRRAIASIYSSALADLDGLRLPVEGSERCHVYHLYVVRTKRRQEFQRSLSDHGIASALHYPIPLHFQEAYRDLGYGKCDFPESESAAEECISLPLYPEMTQAQIEHVVGTVRSFFGR